MSPLGTDHVFFWGLLGWGQPGSTVMSRRLDLRGFRHKVYMFICALTRHFWCVQLIPNLCIQNQCPRKKRTRGQLTLPLESLNPGRVVTDDQQWGLSCDFLEGFPRVRYWVDHSRGQWPLSAFMVTNRSKPWVISNHSISHDGCKTLIHHKRNELGVSWSEGRLQAPDCKTTCYRHRDAVIKNPPTLGFWGEDDPLLINIF